MAKPRKPQAPTGRKHTRETINRALQDRKIRLVEEYTHAKDYLLYQCEHGHEWQNTLNAVLYQGRGCPKCGTYRAPEKEPREVIDGRTRNRSFFRVTNS